MDRLSLLALGGSVFFHVLIWGVFSPVLLLPLSRFNRLDTIYLGTVGGGTDSVNVHLSKMGRMAASVVDYIIKSNEIRKDNMLSYCPVRVVYSFPISVENAGEKLIRRRFRESVIKDKRTALFYRGDIKHFPDGKRYHFCPKYLYPNVYKMMLFSKYVEFGYD